MTPVGIAVRRRAINAAVGLVAVAVRVLADACRRDIAVGRPVAAPRLRAIACSSALWSVRLGGVAAAPRPSMAPAPRARGPPPRAAPAADRPARCRVQLHVLSASTSPCPLDVSLGARRPCRAPVHDRPRAAPAARRAGGAIHPASTFAVTPGAYRARDHHGARGGGQHERGGGAAPGRAGGMRQDQAPRPQPRQGPVRLAAVSWSASSRRGQLRPLVHPVGPPWARGPRAGPRALRGDARRRPAAGQARLGAARPAPARRRAR